MTSYSFFMRSRNLCFCLLLMGFSVSAWAATRFERASALDRRRIQAALPTYNRRLQWLERTCMMPPDQNALDRTAALTYVREWLGMARSLSVRPVTGEQRFRLGFLNKIIESTLSQFEREMRQRPGGRMRTFCPPHDRR
jgi:hypothetical protein